MAPDGFRLTFEDHFDSPVLDESVWFPHYLPAWSSRTATAATYEIRDSCLILSIPQSQGEWLPGEHVPPLRISGVQSGNFSGPIGSVVGQQPLWPGIVVREQQDPFWGWTPRHGYLEMRARGIVSGRSMFAWWMVGLEDIPDRCGEICVAEIFGSAIEAGSAAVGMGHKAIRDPNLRQDFEAVRLPLDTSEFHTYAVDWTPSLTAFHVDGNLIRTCRNPPGYPMQMMLAVFDFPDDTNGSDHEAVPEFHIDYLRGYEPVAPPNSI
jgi:Glycosyl hydrolases family 16